MKKKTIGYIVLGVTALWYFALRGVRAFKIKFQGLRYLSATDTSITFAADLCVYNPLLVDIKLKGVEADVYLNGVKCGYINYENNVPVRSKRTTIVTVFITLDAQNIGTTLWNGIKAGTINQINMRLAGDVYFTDNAKFPFDIYYYLSDFINI